MNLHLALNCDFTSIANNEVERVQLEASVGASARDCNGCVTDTHSVGQKAHTEGVATRLQRYKSKVN